MKLHYKPTSIQVNTLGVVLSKIKAKQPNKNVYSWADSLFFNKTLTAPVLHTLKAILSCSGLSKPTLTQINKARTKSASMKFAQCNPVTERTLRRHIKELERLELITVTRTRDSKRNSRNAYAVCVPAEVLSCRSEDIMSASLSTSSVEHDHIDPVNKLTEQPQIGSVGFVGAHGELIKKLAAIGTDIFTAKKMISKVGAARVEQELAYVLSQAKISNKGAYLFKIINDLDKPRNVPEAGGSRMLDQNSEAEVKLRIQHAAERNAKTRGMEDPRLHRNDYDSEKSWFDAMKKYDELVSTEYVRMLNTPTKATG